MDIIYTIVSPSAVEHPYEHFIDQYSHHKETSQLIFRAEQIN